MKSLLTILLVLISFAAYSQTTLQAGVQNQAVWYTSGWGTTPTMLIYLPWDYYSSGKTYPLILYFSGNSEKGNGGADLSLMYDNSTFPGLPYVVKHIGAPYSVAANGDTTRFIVSSLQRSGTINQFGSADWIPTLLSSTHGYGLRVDTNRIYFTGKSQGGYDLKNFVENYVGATAAAVVPMSPVFYDISAASTYNDLPMWFFQGDNDGTVGQSGTLMYNNAVGNGYANKKLTEYSGGHCCWNTFYDPSWNDNQTTRNSPATDNVSIYDWMLQFSLEGSPTPPMDDTATYEIPLSPSAKFWKGDTVFYQLNVDEDTLKNAEYLMDGVIPDGNNGLFASGSSERGYYPIQPVIDLGGLYKITSIQIYDYFGTDTLNIAYGSPYKWADTLRLYENAADTWKNFGADTFYTRYLKVFYDNAGFQKVKELKLIGHLDGADSLSRINPFEGVPIPITTFTMGQFMGFNQILPEEVDSVGSLMRHYLQMNWIDTVTTEHNVDSITFVFTQFGHPENNTDEQGTITNYFFPESPLTSEVKSGENLSAADMHRMALSGTGYFDAFKTTELPAYAGDNGKPIDTVVHPNPDPTNPLVYDRVGRMAWQYAAFYGFETHPADSMQTPYPSISGLGLRALVENGNEMNMNWGSPDQYFSPWQYIVYASVFYDGNLGTVGTRMGIKNADPDMTVIQAGTAGAHIDYLQGMHYASYYMRDDHSAPFDILNFHTYATDGVNGDNSEPYAASPEEYISPGSSTIKQYVKAARTNFPDMPIWLTEWGYDRNRKSSIAVPPIQGKDSAQIQADWIARFWLLLSFSGVDRATIFQLHNDALSTMVESAFVLKFNTMGLVDGHYVADDYSPGTFAHSYYAYPAYYFQKTICTSLYNYKPDSIIYENNDSIWVYRYRSATDPDSVAYAIWSGTQTNRVVDSLSIKTGHASTQARIIKLADKKFYGDTTNVTSNSDGEVSLTISETPQLLFTTDASGGGELVQTDVTPPANDPLNLVLWRVKWIDGYIYLLYYDTETGKYYSIKVK